MEVAPPAREVPELNTLAKLEVREARPEVMLPIAEDAEAVASDKAELTDPLREEAAELADPAAEEAADEADPAAPPKIVVEPMVEVRVDPSVVMVVRRASVEMAESVAVTVPVVSVATVVSVVVVAPAPPAAVEAPEAAEEAALPAAEEAEPPEATDWQYCSPKAIAVAASVGLQTALEQSRMPYRKLTLLQRQATSVGEHPRAWA